MKTCRKGLHQYEGVKCLVCRKNYNNAWHKTNSEREKITGAAWYRANSERKKASREAWYRANPERRKALNAAWIRGNPERRAEFQHRRRARLYGSSDSEPVTAAHKALLFEAQDGCCRYCRTPLGKDKHLDHRIPLARGGAHAPSNVCWTCPSCNLRKNVKTEQEFLNG